MAEFGIIDVHVHTYRDTRTGIISLGGSPGPHGWTATVEDLVPFMEQNGVEKAVQVNLTPCWDIYQGQMRRFDADLTTAQRAEAEEHVRQRVLGMMISRNEWTCDVTRQHSDQLVAFVGIDPLEDADTMVKDLEACHQRGAQGVKLHPPVQHVAPNDRRLWPGYETLERLDMALLSHSGPFRGIDLPESRPKCFEDIARDFPNLTIILAHCGGRPFYDEAVELAGRYANVYFDCTGVVGEGGEERRGLTDDEIVGLFRKLGTERIMFGSDWAGRDPMPDVRRIEQLPMSDEEKRMVLNENARRILRL